MCAIEARMKNVRVGVSCALVLLAAGCASAQRLVHVGGSTSSAPAAPAAPVPGNAAAPAIVSAPAAAVAEQAVAKKTLDGAAKDDWVAQMRPFDGAVSALGYMARGEKPYSKEVPE